MPLEVAVTLRMLVEKALMPPPLPGSRLLPALPLLGLRSHRRRSRLTVPAAAPLGANRSRSVGASRRAVLALMPLKAVQVVPLLVDTCQSPRSELLTLSFRPTTATPRVEVPLSGSEPLATRELTATPALVGSSLANRRVTVPKSIAVELFQTGASFTAVTVMLAVLLAVEKEVLPPLTEVSTRLPALPLL